jgi:sugar lactone lactonase YvrE
MSSLNHRPPASARRGAGSVRPRYRAAAKTGAAIAAVMATAAGALLTPSPTPAGATPRAAAAPSAVISCPSAGCRRAATNIADNSRSVALDGRGHAYVGDAGAKLNEIDLATGARRVVASDLGDAPGVALDGKGHAIVTSWGRGSLWSIDLTTGAKYEITTGLSGAYGVALDGKGHAYVTAWWAATLWQVDLDTGAKHEVTTKISGPLGVGLHAGQLYVSSTGGVLTRVDPETGATTEVARNLGDDTGFALDGAGNAVLTNRGGQMYRVDLSNGAVQKVAEGLGDSWGVAVDAQGNAYASNTSGILWWVKGVVPPSGALSATVTARSSATGAPGQAWLYPSVTVTNTGDRTIGSQPLTVRVPASLTFLENTVTVYHADTGAEDNVTCVRSGDLRALTCNNADLRLRPGQSDALWTAVAISDAATPGRAPVTYTLGTPPFASGSTSVTITG